MAMRKIVMRLCCIPLFFLFGGFITWASMAGPDNASPVSVVERAINDVAADMRSNETLYEKDTKKLQAMVGEKVAPYFDFIRITQLAMARHWVTATDEQRAAIIREYQISFIRSYANTLFLHRNVNPEIHLQPNSPGQKAANDKATIKMKVDNNGGEPVILILRLEKKQDQWKVIDVNVEGVSLVIIARGQFADKIAKEGIDGLVQSLAEENKQRSL